LDGCTNSWNIPNQADCEPLAFFNTIRDGVWPEPAPWTKERLAPCPDPDAWSQPMPGLFYNPCRMGEGSVTEKTVELCREYAADLPMQILEAEGYLSNMFRTKDGIVVHMLAADYDVDIDHRLDDMRYHRSRVNYVNQVKPAGVSRLVRMESKTAPQVFLPFHDEAAQVQFENGVCSVALPEDCSYLLMYFPQE
jgi:hypothetical protein